MRILLLHPADKPWQGDWVQCSWDLIVDLGFAGPSIYADWSARTAAPIISLHQFAGELDGYRWVNRLLEIGRGRLLDHLGLDWWEIISVWSYQQLHLLYLLRRLREHLGSAPIEWFATRPSVHTDLLSLTSGEAIQYFASRKPGAVTRLSRIALAFGRLSLPQIAEICFDKWDSGYALRRYFARRARCDSPVLLLPSAYSNVTRVLLSYASQLPQRQFLLAVTRRSGLPRKCPPNVSVTSLAAYAAPPAESPIELKDVLAGWNSLQKTLDKADELKEARRAGVFDFFPKHLATALHIRNAWARLMNDEPVDGVLCGDDLNYYTRLPLLLARQMGKQALYCYHGALDGGLLFKQALADTHLVKSEMERDYMLRACAFPPHAIEMAAPNEIPRVASGQSNSHLVFFSEPYENSGGRTEEIYRELLPRLSSLAQQVGRKLVVKLHPFESRKERTRLVRSVLHDRNHSAFEVLSDVPAEELIAGAWCGIGVSSSVAIDCTLRGVPFFLCGWLDCNGFGYGQQFARFNAGTLLRDPQDIERIPEMAARYEPCAASLQRLWHPAGSEQLDDIFFGKRAADSAIQCAS